MGGVRGRLLGCVLGGPPRVQRDQADAGHVGPPKGGLAGYDRTWMSVHVLREHNTIADDLSKFLVSKVQRSAEAKGLSHEERPVPGWIMRALLDTLGL